MCPHDPLPLPASVKGFFLIAGIVTICCQLGALAILWRFSRPRGLATLQGLFLSVAFVYHGVSLILISSFPGAEDYPGLASVAATSEWRYLVGAAFLGFAAGGALTSSLFAQRHTSPNTAGRKRAEFSLPRPWVLLGLVLPMYLVALAGRGLVAPSTSQVGATGYYSGGLTSQFLLVGMVVLALSILVHRGPKKLPLVLLGSSFAFALIGQRTWVVGTAILLLISLRRLGISPSSKSLALATIPILTVAILLSSTRAVEGRQAFTFGSGYGTRISALDQGARHMSVALTWSGFEQDYIGRLDGNVFPSFLVERLAQGYRPTGWSPIVNGIGLAIPSFLNPHKADTSLSARNEEHYLESAYSAPPNVNFLPTFFGSMCTYFGTHWLPLLSALLGAILAVLDWMLRKRSTITTLVFLALGTVAVGYESTPPNLWLSLRGAALLLIVIVVLRWFRDVATSSRSGTMTSASYHVT